MPASPLHLLDNWFGANGLLFGRNDRAFESVPGREEGLAGQHVSEGQRKLLDQYGRLSFGELSELSHGAIVDLSGSHLDETGRKELRFFEYHAKPDDGNAFRLDTGNLMGALRFRNHETSVQVEVLSRFDKGGNNFFLNYLLSRAFDVAIGEDPVSAKQPSVLDLLLDVLFVRRFGEASRNGLLRQYRTYRNNDWAFKGCLDLPRHIRENVPLPRGVAYVKREIDLDVPVNRLLLLAALVVRKRRPDLFERNEDARDALRELRTAIPDPGDVRSVLSHRDCREPVRHPFYREVWEPLRQIARMILEEERWMLFQDDEEETVSGVVFDGAWLWEEYVARVLEKVGFHHSVTEDGFVRRILPAFQNGPSRFAPDLFLRHPDAAGFVYDCVLDTKYKRSNPNGGRNDVHQVLCYLLLSGAKLGGLVFPPVDPVCETGADRDGEFYGNSGWSKERTIDSPYSTEAFPIHWRCFSWGPVVGGDWTAFQTYMAGQESALIGGLQTVTGVENRPSAG